MKRGAGFLFLAVIAAAGCRPAPAKTDLGSVQPFTLINQDGRRIGLDDLRGKHWVADFIFTRCQGPCPLLTTRMSELEREFHKKPNLRFVSFTVDPAFDKPAVLKDYAERFGADPARWFFLSGARKEIYGLIQNSFRLAVEPNPEAKADFGDGIVHSLYFVLVDPEGKIVGYYNAGEPGDLATLRSRLKKTA